MSSTYRYKKHSFVNNRLLGLCSWYLSRELKLALYFSLDYYSSHANRVRKRAVLLIGPSNQGRTTSNHRAVDLLLISKMLPLQVQIEL